MSSSHKRSCFFLALPTPFRKQAQASCLPKKGQNWTRWPELISLVNNKNLDFPLFSIFRNKGCNEFSYLLAPFVSLGMNMSWIAKTISLFLVMFILIYCSQRWDTILALACKVFSPPKRHYYSFHSPLFSHRPLTITFTFGPMCHVWLLWTIIKSICPRLPCNDFSHVVISSFSLFEK